MALQYNIELAIDGMEDGPPGGMKISERLEALRKRRAAWTTMQPSERRPIKTSMQAMQSGHFVWANHHTKQLHAWRIPSVYRGISAKECVVKGIDVKEQGVGALAIDPDQDLLVLYSAP